MDSNPKTNEENNIYLLNNFKDTDAEGQRVVFYKKNEDGTDEEGTTLEAMLEVSITRLQDLNNRFGCRENSLAITKMQEALFWLEERTRERKARGVEGQHVA